MSLNEGGGFHPRNAAKMPQKSPINGRCKTLNEGGGFHPRNGARKPARGMAMVVFLSLNEGGGFHPRNAGPSDPANADRDEIAQ